MKILIVCFYNSEEFNYGVGNYEMNVNRFPLSIEEIKNIEDEIKKTLNFSNMIVLNMMPLEDD